MVKSSLHVLGSGLQVAAWSVLILLFVGLVAIAAFLTVIVGLQAAASFGQ